MTGIEKPMVSNGICQLPKTPGLGIELNEAVVREHLIKGIGLLRSHPGMEPGTRPRPAVELRTGCGSLADRMGEGWGEGKFKPLFSLRLGRPSLVLVLAGSSRLSWRTETKSMTLVAEPLLGTAPGGSLPPCSTFRE